MPGGAGGGVTPKLLWCPSDQTLVRFLQNPKPYPWYARQEQIYQFSYCLSRGSDYHAQGSTAGGWAESRQHGMASIIHAIWSSSEDINRPLDENDIFFFNSTWIRSPSQKILFAEIPMLYEISEAQYHQQTRPEREAVDYPAWSWPFQKLATRHIGRADVSLADGHVETVRPEFGEQIEHCDPLY